MLLSSPVREYLVSTGLTHHPMNTFGCAYASEYTIINITVNSVRVLKWSEQSGTHKEVLTAKVDPLNMSVTQWKGILMAAGVPYEASNLHPVFESIVNSFNKAV